MQRETTSLVRGPPDYDEIIESYEITAMELRKVHEQACVQHADLPRTKRSFADGQMKQGPLARHVGESCEGRFSSATKFARIVPDTILVPAAPAVKSRL